MTYSYFPGCTLKTKGKDLETYGLAAAEALGIELQELPDWQCCGAVYPQVKNDIAPKLPSVRALASAKEKEQALVTLCSACHHVIKRVNHQIQNDAEIGTKINNYLKLDDPYNGETQVLHYLEVLRDELGFDELAKKVTNPLTGRKIGAYYGCMLLRPSAELAFDDPENPRIIEDFIRALGAEPVVYAMRNECCGGYVTIKDKAFAGKKAAAIVENARAPGCEALITACPLCMYNLKENASNPLPVYYFTELLAEALSLRKED